MSYYGSSEHLATTTGIRFTVITNSQKKKSLHLLYAPPTAVKLYYMHINLTIHDGSQTCSFFLNQCELDLNLSSYTSGLPDILLIMQELKHGTQLKVGIILNP